MNPPLESLRDGNMDSARQNSLQEWWGESAGEEGGIQKTVFRVKPVDKTGENLCVTGDNLWGKTTICGLIARVVPLHVGL